MRLHAIDPDAFAARVYREHLGDVQRSVRAMGLELSAPAEGRERSRLVRDLVGLVRYAQAGQPLRRPVLAHLERLSYLWGSLDVRPVPGSPPVLPPESELGTVVNAALGREAVEQGRDVPVRWLAALVGFHEKSVLRLLKQGELQSAGRGLVEAASARRLLAATESEVE